MPDENGMYDLERFVKAQAEGEYETALSEIRAGEKVSHWMWFIFPQIKGLGSSQMSMYFAIQDLGEARAYLRHPVLGPRLEACTVAVLELEGKTALEIFGSPNDMKLRSCATLFAMASAPGSVFERVLEKYFGGMRDEKTVERLS